ncbi:MAG: hypothetical protein ABL994_25150 [Verrucomicrobiales bacterium]
MKKILTILASFALASAASAGCGKTVENKGSLSSYDAVAKVVVVKDAEGKEAKLTLTPTSTITDKDGKVAKIEDLAGKSVVVVSEHNKVQTVKEQAAS